MPIRDLFGLLTKRQSSPDKYLGSSVNIVGTGLHGAKRPPFSQLAAIRHFRSWIYAAASINANAVSSVPLRLYVSKDAAKQKVNKTRKVTNHRKAYLHGDGYGDQRPSMSVLRKIADYGEDFEEVTGENAVTNLLMQSNPFMNGFDMTVLRILYGELTGNAYFHPVFGDDEVPTELWPLAPQYTEVIPDEDEFISGYVYGIDTQHKQVFERDEVIHFRRPNPDNLYYGLGKVEAAYGAILSNQALHDMDLAMYQNSARPDYAVVVKGAPTGDQLDRFQQQVENRLKGTRKEGSFIAVTGDVQFTPLNFPPKDIVGREDIVEEIAAVFGVPVSMLKANDPNLASSQTGFAQWREGTVLPLCRMDEQELNQSLLPMFGLGEEYCLAYDNPVPRDKSFELSERQAAVAGGWRTPNEARVEEGMEPIDNEFADQLLMGGQPLGAGMGMGMGMGMPMGMGMGMPPSAPDAPQTDEAAPPATPEESGAEANPDVGISVGTENTLNGAQVSSMMSVLQGVADGSITSVAAIEVIVALGVAREHANRMVQSQEAEGRPVAEVEAEHEANNPESQDKPKPEKPKIEKPEPSAMAEKVLRMVSNGNLEGLAAIKSLQKCGFTRAVAEKMVDAQIAKRKTSK